jgi:hypothetical protein
VTAEVVRKGLPLDMKNFWAGIMLHSVSGFGGIWMLAIYYNP